jgi:predicted MFS family arabinose efflux permease|eukprot:COSAG06_NODE_6556_length_2882_cov_12.489041_4_plen_122_part_00
MQGYLLGFSGGGWLVQEYGWQDTFIFVGAPQCLLALFFHLTVPSPPAIKPTNSVLVDIQILARKTPLRAIWAGMFITTVGAAMNKFLPSFYQRVHGAQLLFTPCLRHLLSRAPLCSLEQRH